MKVFSFSQTSPTRKASLGLEILWARPAKRQIGLKQAGPGNVRMAYLNRLILNMCGSHALHEYNSFADRYLSYSLAS